MKKLKRSIALLCSGVCFLLSCNTGDATFNIKAKNYGNNDVIGIYPLTSRDPLIAKNLVNGDQTISLYLEKKNYAKLRINREGSSAETEFFVYLDNATYELEMDPENRYDYPIKHSSSKSEQEIIDYYKIRDDQRKAKQNKRQMDSDLDAIHEFAQSHPSSDFVVLILEDLEYSGEKYALYQTIFDLLDPKVKDSKAGKRLQKQILVSKNMAIGSTVPTISGKNLQGEGFNPKVLKSVNVFICWASYDAPSRKNNKELVSLYEKYKSKGVEFIGVSYDKKEDWWQTVIKDDKATWPQYNDFLGAKSPNADLSDHRLPYMMITDQSGKILNNDISIQHLDLEIDEKLIQLKQP